MHWNRDVSESEEAAQKLYRRMLREADLTVGDTKIRFLVLQVPDPIDVGTDDTGIYEYVIWVDFVYQREEDEI